MNDYLTSAVHFELLKNYASIGTTHDVQLGNYGLISTSIASNFYKVTIAQKGSFETYVLHTFYGISQGGL